MATAPLAMSSNFHRGVELVAVILRSACADHHRPRIREACGRHATGHARVAKIVATTPHFGGGPEGVEEEVAVWPPELAVHSRTARSKGGTIDEAHGSVAGLATGERGVEAKEWWHSEARTRARAQVRA